MAFAAAIFTRALAARNYRIYFLGQLVSLAGTWMQQIAMSWLAYRLTGSALVLGTVGFASQIPILLFSPFAGVLTDRVDRRRLMMLTQALALLQALLLALLTWQGGIDVPWLIALAFLLGCINTVDMPARQAFSVQLVDRREDLANAIALNSFLMNAARFVGPTLAGFAVVWLGEAACFLMNAASYLAVLAALAAIDSRPQPARPTSALDALKDGLRYVFGHADIRARLLVVAAVSFLVTPYAVMMPLFAREIFGGGAQTYGLLIGCAGLGSLSASLYLASRSGIERLPRRVASAVIAAGLALAAFAVNRHLPLAFVAVAALGFSVILVIAGSNTLIQTQLHDDYRGRVMAIFSMAFLGIAPLGSLAVGSLADAAGVPATLFVCGLATAAVGLFARRRLAPPRA